MPCDSGSSSFSKTDCSMKKSLSVFAVLNLRKQLFRFYTIGGFRQGQYLFSLLLLRIDVTSFFQCLLPKRSCLDIFSVSSSK